MVSNDILRARARKTLGGNIFSSNWLYPLLASLIISAISGIAGTLIIGILASGILFVGQSKYYLNISRRTTPNDNIQPLTEGIKNDVAGNVILGLLINIFVFLWTLLFIIPGIVKSYSYSMAYYIKCDHPEYSAQQAIDESRRIMHGNKWKLFMLDLSFIGWIILGSLCFGIGTLWVAPYMQAARAEFYLDIIGEEGVDPLAQEEISSFIDFE